MDSSYSNEEGQYETHYATALRSSPTALKNDLQTISKSPIINALLEVVSGLLAVLNENRQILAVNHSMLTALGIKDPENIMGLRPGEAIECTHAYDEPGGCGTSTFCSTCGAAIAIVTCLAENKPAQKDCIVTVEKAETPIDLYFRIRCSPIKIEDQRFLLLFLQDITVEQQHSALERVFFHDISNTISALKLSSQLLENQTDASLAEELRVRIKHLAMYLEKEVEIQRVLCYRESHTYDVHFEEIPIKTLLDDLREMFSSHPVAMRKSLIISNHTHMTHLVTDFALLKRVLVNIVINAFEASRDGKNVELSVDDEMDTVTFSVWNASVIPHDVGLRIFQRNFSTKTSKGRGLGTYGMKLFGETYLQGKVSFTSAAKHGTTFFLELPKHPVSETS
ncbi:MAG: HAMP domain-containing histidine kinase [Phycisphaerae bacterium]|nr:HAMP domain-containing histidine kinase [Phycisphaerae bacterium]